jgi:small subunit ribosomal protein S17
MDKSRVVEHTRVVRHPLYGKQVRRRKRYMIHDSDNVSKNGDVVVIEECRPLSARKRWRLRQVIDAAPAVVAETENGDPE